MAYSYQIQSFLIFLYTGTIFATFTASGAEPVYKDLLMMIVNGRQISAATILINVDSNPSCPIDFFPWFE